MEENLIDKFVGKMKLEKVSFNLPKPSLEMIDDLAKVCNLSRTYTINMLMGDGCRKTVDDFEKRWNVLKKEKNHKPKEINRKLVALQKFKKKHGF